MFASCVPAMHLQNPLVHIELHRHVMSTMFTGLSTTQRSIRKILGAGSGDPEAVDSLALARVQLEALYGLCLMFESGEYVGVDLQDGWRTAYVKFLLVREECKNLPRFNDFINVQAPKSLEGLRTIAGVTEAQKFTVESDQLGAPMPQGVIPELIKRFPTPGKVIDTIASGDRQRMLIRLYPEYQQLSSIAHSRSDSGVFRAIFNSRSEFRRLFKNDELEDAFKKDVSERAFMISLLSMVQSAAELVALYPGDVDLRAAVMDSWKYFSESTLIGKTIWAIRTRVLLGALA